MALFKRGVYQSPLNWKTTSAAELPQVYLSDGYLCFLWLKKRGGGRINVREKALEKKKSTFPSYITVLEIYGAWLIFIQTKMLIFFIFEKIAEL